MRRVCGQLSIIWWWWLRTRRDRCVWFASRFDSVAVACGSGCAVVKVWLENSDQARAATRGRRRRRRTAEGGGAMGRDVLVSERECCSGGRAERRERDVTKRRDQAGSAFHGEGERRGRGVREKGGCRRLVTVCSLRGHHGGSLVWLATMGNAAVSWHSRWTPRSPRTASYNMRGMCLCIYLTR